MKRKRHTPEQIVKKLRVASEELGRGKELGEVCRQLEVSEAGVPPFFEPTLMRVE